MSDNDLIRRGDALALCDQYPYVEGVKTALHDIPATQPTVSPDVAALLDAAEKVINSYWHSTDGVITGIYDLEAALAELKGESQ